MTAEVGFSGVQGRSITADKRVERVKRPIASNRFHWIAVLLSAWFVSGAYLDAWAHNNIPTLETFFTPWHGILYSGAALVFAFMTFTQIRNNAKGYPVLRSMPEGYGLTLAALIGFAVGGVGDLIWHTVFGIEKSMEAAISPTHLFLMLCGVFVVSGSLRAGWRRSRTTPPKGFIEWGPILLSLTLTLLFLMTLPQIVHPLLDVLAGNREIAAGGANRNVLQLIGSAGILLNAAVLMGVLLLAIRRWALPFGTFTFMFAAYVLALTAMQGQYRFIPGVILTGLTADLLNRWLKPSENLAARKPAAIQVFAFVIPLVFYLFYFLTIALTEGVWWSIHMWLGMSVIAALIGLGLAALLTPTWQPADETA